MIVNWKHVTDYGQAKNKSIAKEAASWQKKESVLVVTNG